MYKIEFCKYCGAKIGDTITYHCFNGSVVKHVLKNIVVHQSKCSMKGAISFKVMKNDIK